jgi:hypothetical protein
VKKKVKFLANRIGKNEVGGIKRSYFSEMVKEEPSKNNVFTVSLRNIPVSSAPRYWTLVNDGKF